MNKKYRIILSLILAVSLCTACEKQFQKQSLNQQIIMWS